MLSAQDVELQINQIVISGQGGQCVELAGKNLWGAVNVPIRKVEQHATFQIVNQRTQTAKGAASDFPVCLDHGAGIGNCIKAQKAQVPFGSSGQIGVANQLPRCLFNTVSDGVSPSVLPCRLVSNRSVFFSQFSRNGFRGVFTTVTNQNIFRVDVNPAQSLNVGLNNGSQMVGLIVNGQNDGQSAQEGQGAGEKIAVQYRKNRALFKQGLEAAWKNQGCSGLPSDCVRKTNMLSGVLVL